MENTLKAAFRWVVFVFAVSATTAWLVLCFTYLNRLGWDGILSLEPGDLAALLAAVAGPPAALWLVLMVIAQQQELKAINDAMHELGRSMRRGQDQVEVNSRALMELLSVSQRGGSEGTLRLALNDLAGQAATVAERLGVLDRDNLDVAWARYGAGDPWAFCQPFIVRANLEPDFSERLIIALQEDPSAQLSADAFVRRLEILRKDDSLMSDHKLIHDLIEAGPLVQLSRLFVAGVGAQGSGGDNRDLPDELVATSPDAVDAINDRLGPQPTLFPSGSAPD